MTEIQIKKSVKLEMSLIESEDHLPSIRMDVKLEIDSISLFSYRRSVWFDCDQWDSFHKNLHRMSEGHDAEARLSDMSENINIRIVARGKRTELAIECKESNPKTGEMSLSYKNMIDAEMLFEIKENFDNFPKWW